MTATKPTVGFIGLGSQGAPVSGGGEAARARRLLVMVGGDHGVYATVATVLSAFGDPVVHVGALGAGQQAGRRRSGAGRDGVRTLRVISTGSNPSTDQRRPPVSIPLSELERADDSSGHQLFQGEEEYA